MRWLDGRYRGLITRGRSRRASLDDFCNRYDPQARSARSVDTLFPLRETEVPCGEEQVRAPRGASQPRPFGRGSMGVAGRNPYPMLLPPRLLVCGRATPARSGLEHLCRETLALRDVEPSRGPRPSPDRARCRARRPVTREGRFTWASAKRTHITTHPRCFRSPGLLVRGWADPFSTPSLEKRGNRPSACSISARHPLHGRCYGVGGDSTHEGASSFTTPRSGKCRREDVGRGASDDVYVPGRSAAR